MVKMREEKSLFRCKTSTDVSRLTTSCASSVAIRCMCAPWQTSHHFQFKLFSCGSVSTTRSPNQGLRYFSLEFFFKKANQNKANKPNLFLMIWHYFPLKEMVVLCLFPTDSEIRRICWLTWEEKQKTYQKSRKISSISVSTTISSFSLFSLSFYTQLKFHRFIFFLAGCPRSQ